MLKEFKRHLPKAERGEVHNGIHNCLFLFSVHSLFVLEHFMMIYTYHVINIYGQIKVLQETRGIRKYLILSMVSFYLFPTCLVWGEEGLWGIAQQGPLDKKKKKISSWIMWNWYFHINRLTIALSWKIIYKHTKDKNEGEKYSLYL